MGLREAHNKKWIAVAGSGILLVAVLIFISSLAFFTVQPDEVAIVTQFGRIAGEPVPPGLHFKLPVVQEIHRYSVRRVYQWNGHPENLWTLDKNEVRVLPAVMWRIKDPVLFFKTVYTVENAGMRIADRVYAALRDTLVSHEYQNLQKAHLQKNDGKSLLGSEIVDGIQKQIEPKLHQFGIEVHLLEVVVS